MPGDEAPGPDGSVPDTPIYEELCRALGAPPATPSDGDAAAERATEPPG